MDRGEQERKAGSALLEELKNRILFFDGGTGSLLQAAGLGAGELPETWNISHPETVVKIHRDYLNAGCDMVKTNTFGANRLKFNDHTEFTLREVVEAAVANARQAAKEAGHGWIALDLGPTGRLLKPMGDLEFETAVSMYRETAQTGVQAGADLILIETMSDSYELKAAVLGAKEALESLGRLEGENRIPIFATVIFDGKGKLLTGGTARSVIALLEGLGVDALGVNCGLGPVEMKEIVKEYVQYASLPIIVNPNAGLPRSEGGKTVYDIDGEAFAKAMEELVDLGVSIAGGCCGTTPEHIQKLTERCRGKKQRLPEKKTETVISSYAQAVEIGVDPVVIGERINPTGKSKFKEALRTHNMEYFLREGVIQQEHGAQVLDVNVGLPEIDEPAMMEEAVRELQSIIDLPLQIDTADGRALERALRVYNGKPLVNSVNGKKESMETVFPLVKKYGGTVVALTLDESGIPATADGRLAVAEKIYRKAAEYGIQKKDIIIDPLCMTISSDSQGALTTLEAVHRVKEDLGGKTILGVSNISFGLPQREIINSSFFTLALMNGLNAAIINPNSEAMMRSLHSFRALAALDDNCRDYIEMYGQSSSQAALSAPSQAAKPSGEAVDVKELLKESVVRGLKEQAAEQAGQALREEDPLEIINLCMIPALDSVGKGFEKGTIFLPQLLMSAEAAKAAFEVIKEAMEGSGQTQEKKGVIILATVKGDIHDIGKNIVKVLLENYSYEVVDLGRDVPPEKIAEETVKRRAPLVGLSALMTTTVPSMEETIRLLRKEAPWTRIMVGGAVLTEEYAKSIGADVYCRDAMASVTFAQKVIG